MDKACLLHSLNIKGLVARETEKEWSGRVWDTCATWSCCGEKKDILLRWHYLSLILRTFIPYVPKCHLWLKTLNCKRFLMSHSFLFLCTLISYLTNVKTNKFVYFFYFSTNLTDDSVVGEQLCWKRNDTTKFSEKCSTQEAQPPSGTADPLLGGKVDHLRPAWTGPLLPLKFLTLATLMPGCPDKYKHLVRDSSIYENQEPRTQNWGKTQRRSHPKPLGGG